VWRILATVVCLGVHGCTQPTGGAVELSWALRSTLDRDISDCANERIGRIRLWWDTGRDTRWVAFPCEDNHGVTAFDLPTGSVALSISPECLDGKAANPASFTGAAADRARRGDRPGRDVGRALACSAGRRLRGATVHLHTVATITPTRLVPAPVRRVACSAHACAG
jgi:hypothetical protein